MTGQTIAALIIGLVAGYVLVRAMQPPVARVALSAAPPPAPPGTQPTLSAVDRARQSGNVGLTGVSTMYSASTDPRFATSRPLILNMDSLAS